MSPTNTYVELLDAFNSASEILWNKSEHNEVSDCVFSLSDRESEAADAFDLAIASLHAKRA